MCDLANLENLDGARLVRVYTSQEGYERVYAWFGESQVSIYDTELKEIDVFNIDLFPMKPTVEVNVVESYIEIHEDEWFMKEVHTNDMFYDHAYETGEELETQ